MIHRFQILIWLSLLSLPWTGLGQTNSVDELVAEALRDNPDLASAEADVAAARGERRATGQWKNPEISAEYGEKRVFDRSTGELNGKGNAQNYSIMQTFEFPGKASLRKAIANQNIHLAELALEQMRLEVSAQARELTIQWVTAEQLADAEREVADRSETLVKMLGKRAPAGVQALLDQRIIEASLVSILTRTREAEEKRDGARFALNSLRGRKPNDPLRVTASMTPSPTKTEWAVLVERAKDSSLVLKSRNTEVEKAEKSLSQAKLGSAPDFSIGPFYSEERAVDRERVLGVGVSMPLPIWDSNRGQTEAARAGVAQAHARKDQASRDLERELAEHVNAYHLALKQLEKTPPEMLARLRDGAELADRQYRLGAVSVQTYLDMQQQYLEATDGILGAVTEAHARLLKIQVITADAALWSAPPQEKKP